MGRLPSEVSELLVFIHPCFSLGSTWLAQFRVLNPLHSFSITWVLTQMGPPPSTSHKATLGSSGLKPLSGLWSSGLVPVYCPSQVLCPLSPWSHPSPALASSTLSLAPLGFWACLYSPCASDILSPSVPLDPYGLISYGVNPLFSIYI